MPREIHGPETTGPLPRSAQRSWVTGVLGLLVLFVLSPVAPLVAVAAAAGVLVQLRRHWWEIAGLAGLVCLATVLVEQQLGGGFGTAHYGGLAAAWAGSGSWWWAVASTVPVGVPAGIAAGALFVGVVEEQAGGAEWHPVEQRRRAVEEAKTDDWVAALLADPAAAETASSPPLGALRGGDEVSGWTEPPFVVVPAGRFPAMGLVGESGSGKTVTAERLVTVWATAGRQVIFADFKGTDPELPQRLLAAYLQVIPDARCALWPAQPLDIWRGSPGEMTNTLLQVQEYTEPYYQAVAQTAIRLALHAPDVDGRGPVASPSALLRRLDVEWLRRAYRGNVAALADVAALARSPALLDGVRLRYSGFFAGLAGRFERAGGFGFEDCDLVVLTAPTIAQRVDAMAAARLMLTDFGAYCVARKPRIGHDVTLIVDEFSAVTGAAPFVIDLAERVRDVGGQVVVSVQSWEGLGGSDAERRRMRDALAPGGLIVHRLADPDEVLAVAGTVHGVEQSWQLDGLGAAGTGTARMAPAMRVDPDVVRQADTGEAWIVTRGLAARMTVLRTPISDTARDAAHRLVTESRPAVTSQAAPRPPESRLAPAPRRPAISGSLSELIGAQSQGPPPTVSNPPPEAVTAAALDAEVVRDAEAPPNGPAGSPAGSGAELPPAGPAAPGEQPSPGPGATRARLAITAYVRAGLVEEAVAVAEATGVSAGFVEAAVQRRRAHLEHRA